MENISKFPLEVFPKNVQDVLSSFAGTGIPVDYYGGTFLSVVSTLIGNNFKASYFSKGPYVLPNFFMAIIGGSGWGKTPAMHKMISPILNDDSFSRVKNRFLLNSTKEYICERYNITGQSGILLYNDELNSWLQNEEVNFWLEAEANQSIRIEKSGEQSVFLKQLFVNVIGSLQLSNFYNFSENIFEHALAGRTLYIFPDDPPQKYFEDYEPQTDSYKLMLKNIIDVCGGIHRNITLKLDDEAKKYFMALYRLNVDAFNKIDCISEKGVLARREIRIIKFSILLHLLQLLPTNQTLSQLLSSGDYAKISKDSIQGGEKLSDYFEHTYRKVNKLIKSDRTATV